MVRENGAGNKMDMNHKTYYSSPIGTIEITGTTAGILSIDFVEDPDTSGSETHPCLEPCVTQLHEYFLGRLKKFTVPLQIRGTVFQKKVWSALLQIPYGTTQSYAEIAGIIGHKKAFRAVGNANNRNNIAIIIPCHRVIGSDGSLTGYATGIWRKEWLLEHEKRFL